MRNLVLLLASFMALVLCSVEARSGDATWYDLSVGLTACGTQHQNNELVAATAFHFWTTPNPNRDPMCQRRARVTNPANGRTVTVRIRDKCSGCRGDDLDLSPTAFQQLGVALGVGRFRINWDFV